MLSCRNLTSAQEDHDCMTLSSMAGQEILAQEAWTRVKPATVHSVFLANNILSTQFNLDHILEKTYDVDLNRICKETCLDPKIEEMMTVFRYTIYFHDTVLNNHNS